MFTSDVLNVLDVLSLAPIQVVFVEMDQRNTTLLALMGQGLHSMPIVQILHKVRSPRGGGGPYTAG